MAYDNLRQTITGNIYSNNSQEITGDILQEVLLEVVQVMEDEDQELDNSLSKLGEERVTPSQMAAAIKVEVDKINETFETKANIDKSYPKMTVGFAQDIVGDGSATTEEFSFRPTAGEDRNVANTTYYEGERNGSARIEKVMGSSVVINQKARLVTAGESNNGITMTVDSNGLLLNGTATSQSVIRIVQYGSFTYNVGHKYILVVDAIDLSANNNVRFSDFNLANVFGNTSFIYTPSTANVCNIVIVIKSGVTLDNYRISGIISSDLTQMFGAGNEPTTVEEFYQRLPKGVDINAYNAGKIVDGNYGAIKTVGFNAFNGTYAKVCGGCPYYLGGNYTSLGFTTEEGGSTEAITLPTSTESVGITPNDRLYTPSQNGYIYAEGENININLSWDTEYGYLNGTYQPYKPFERDLSLVAKYFPNGMRSAGSERDEIRFNPTTQKWEAVQNVGVRAYAEGDAEDTSVTTDGTNTNYALGTPIVTEIIEDVNLDFDVSDYGTEELIVADGAQSAPLVADITYAPNALSTIKQVPDILKRLKALESAVAQQTTNVEPSNIEE